MKYLKQILVSLCICLPLLSYAGMPGFGPENITITKVENYKSTAPLVLNLGTVTLESAGHWIFHGETEMNIQNLIAKPGGKLEFLKDASIETSQIEGALNIYTKDSTVNFYYNSKGPITTINTHVSGSGTINVIQQR